MRADTRWQGWFGDGPTPLIGVRSIAKSYSGNLVLNRVSLAVGAGEIRGLVGENGAGKSTLMRIVSGATRADSGEMYLDGKQVQYRNVALSRRAGISVVCQEHSLLDNLSVGENIFLGGEVRGRIGGVAYNRQEARSLAVLQRLGVEVSPGAYVGRLNMAERELVEIAKAIRNDCRVLVLDEPTAPLNSAECDRLFEIVKGVAQTGTAVIYISHRLTEVFDLVDSISVLKDGVLEGTWPREAVSPEDVVRSMVGRELGDVFPAKRTEPAGDVVLRVDGLANGQRLSGVSFDVGRGEIVGIAGLEGSGTRELVRAIYGADRGATGRIVINGKNYRLGRPSSALAAGITFVSDDRRTEGLIGSQSILENLSLPSLERLQRFGVVWWRKARALAEGLVRDVDIRGARLKDSVGALSGGNQQKVALGKWLPRAPQVFLFHEPTRGIDIGARVAIYRVIRGLADQGTAILIASGDLIELIGLSDRVIVLRSGRIVRELAGAAITEEEVMMAATGQAIDAAS